MDSNCSHCGLQFEREQGYFVGAIYINYAATVAIAVPGFFILDVFGALSIDGQLAIWLPFSIVFPLLFFHHSRSIWLTLDHLLNPERNLYSIPPTKKVSGFSSGNDSPPLPTHRADHRPR